MTTDLLGNAGYDMQEEPGGASDFIDTFNTIDGRHPHRFRRQRP